MGREFRNACAGIRQVFLKSSLDATGLLRNFVLLHSQTWNVMISEVNFAYTMHHAWVLQSSLTGSSFLKYCFVIGYSNCILSESLQNWQHVDCTRKTFFQCVKDILCTVVMGKYMNIQHNVLSYKPLYNHVGSN